MKTRGVTEKIARRENRKKPVYPDYHRFTRNATSIVQENILVYNTVYIYYKPTSGIQKHTTSDAVRQQFSVQSFFYETTKRCIISKISSNRQFRASDAHALDVN